MAKWLPGWMRHELGPSGGTFDETSNPKGCLHTTEGGSLSGAENAYYDYPPHLGYDPIRRIKHQYVPLDRHSYAFRGSESDDEYVIQVEIVGYASQTHMWNHTMYRNIGLDVIAPLESEVGIPRKALRFYGEMDGIILARSDSPIRLSPGSLRNYSGWLGHQHIPSPDSHWDPGKFSIKTAFAAINPSPETQEEKDAMIDYVRGNSTIKDSSGTPYGYRVFKIDWQNNTSAWVNDRTPMLLTQYRLWKACGNQEKVVEQSILDAFNRVVPNEIQVKE